MTKFLLDTGAVDSVADSLKELSNNARDVMRSVSKYDVENNDNFNFSSAKDAVSTNVSSAYIKFRLTNQYLKKVVSTHTELQESINGGGGGNGDGGANYLTSGGYNGYYTGNYGGSSGITFQEETITSPNGVLFRAGTISLEVLKILLEEGLFTDSTIEKLNSTNEKVLVITISKNDDNYKDKVELAEELAKVYDIDLIINNKEEDDIETSLCIVRNGIVLASTEELTDIEAIKTMFDKVSLDVKDENIEIETLQTEDETSEDQNEESSSNNQDNLQTPSDGAKNEEYPESQNEQINSKNENNSTSEEPNKSTPLSEDESTNN